YGASEIVERTIDNTHQLAGLVHSFVCRLVDRLFQTVHDFVYFALSDGSRLVGATTDEAHDTWGFFNEVPGIIVEHHLDQHVAGEEFAFAAALLAGAHFDNLFSRHQYLTEKISQGRQRNTLFE